MNERNWEYTEWHCHRDILSKCECKGIYHCHPPSITNSSKSMKIEWYWISLVVYDLISEFLSTRKTAMISINIQNTVCMASVYNVGVYIQLHDGCLRYALLQVVWIRWIVLVDQHTWHSTK